MRFRKTCECTLYILANKFNLKAALTFPSSGIIRNQACFVLLFCFY